MNGSEWYETQAFRALNQVMVTGFASIQVLFFDQLLLFLYWWKKYFFMFVVYVAFKNVLIIHEQNTKEIIAVKESLYVIKHT